MFTRTGAAPPLRLFGRDDEVESLRAVLRKVHSGHQGSRAAGLHLFGEPGAGRTVLLDRATELAGPDTPVLCCGGVAAEASTPYAGLQPLLIRLLPRLGTLSETHRAAVAAALDGGPADPARVGLALLDLVATETAVSGPQLLLVDDTQWFDERSRVALFTATRRFHRAPVAVVLSTALPLGERLPRAAADSGLPPLAVPPLADDAARALVLAAVGRSGPPGPPPEEVVRRLLDEAEGNPLVLLELCAALNEGELSGVLPLPEYLASGCRLPELIGPPVRPRPAGTATLLLAAAADRTGSVPVLIEAATRLGVDGAAVLAEAERRGQLVVREQEVTFPRRILRSIVYHSASLDSRRAVHRALAEVLARHPDERVRHRAAATAGFDEEVAAELAGVGARARRGGRPLDASDAYAAAAELSGTSSTRTRYLTEAAWCAWFAGCPARAQKLQNEMQAVAECPEALAAASELKAVLDNANGLVRTAYHELLDSADGLAADDRTAAADLLVMAAGCALTLGDRPGLLAAGEALGRLPLSADAPARVLGEALTELAHGRFPEGGRLAAVSPHWLRPPATRPWIWPPVVVPRLLGNVWRTSAALRRSGETVRSRAQLGALPMLVATAAGNDIADSHWQTVHSDAVAARDLAEQLGQTGALVQLQAVLAWSAAIGGRARECREAAEFVLAEASPRGIASAAAVAHWALALLAEAEGSPQEAAVRLLNVVSPESAGHHFLIAQLVLPDLVGALVRAGDREGAREVLDRHEHAILRDAPELRSLWHRCRALLADDDPEAAGRHFAAALAEDSPSLFDRARTLLLHGKWLRRQRRVIEARGELRAALDLFTFLEARPWIEDTRTELRAAGAPTAAAAERMVELTPREQEIMELAAQGLSNKEIGARLFLSVRTVGYHLHKIFPKFGITSRHQLKDLSRAASIPR
ncbi:LuxR C-terminal-related transcriptional regulator [Amycolatopsis sp. NPDC049252]|uniref:helix-turn-helix transcriptional regulator n=1 Tax=Amycolatopsis sp. NPDC049252 TaxID=3363933 RepID=UPI00371B6323